MSLFQQPASDPNVCDYYNVWIRTARGLVIFIGSGLRPAFGGLKLAQCLQAFFQFSGGQETLAVKLS